MATSNVLTEKLVLPTFLGIGPYKSGTTWLYECLQEHPEVYLPDVKEINFFNIKDGRDFISERGFEWYFDLYRKAGSFPARGDISPGILAEPRAPRLIRQHLPGCKLIAILRNPVGRAVSDYHFLHAKGAITCSLEDLIDHPTRYSSENQRIIQTGFYHRHVCRFLEAVPSDNLFVVAFEDLKYQPQALFERVCRFLAIDETLRPASLTTKVNPARRLRSKAVESFSGRSSRFLRENGLEALRRLIKQSGVPKAIHRINRVPMQNPPLSPRLHQRLQGLYDDDIRQLSRLTGLNLEHWLR